MNEDARAKGGETAAEARAPGRHRQRGLAKPRGREASPQAQTEIDGLLEGQPRRRDLLIEFLHAIQDRYGRLSADHLLALAEALRLAPAEVYEVATFYHNFEVAKEAPAQEPPLPTIRVCESLTCAVLGAQELAAALQTQQDGRARIAFAACMGRCDAAPVVRLGGRYVTQASPARVAAAMEAPVAGQPAPDHTGLAAYRSGGGYRLLADVLEGAVTADSVLQRLEEAGLRGLGGAGFPTARKWRAVRQAAAPRYLAVNADESEPGTFKDRHYLERDPHRVLEGMFVAAAAIEAEAIYFYLRDEYPEIRGILQAELAALSALGMALPPVHLRRGAGAYICGEESAMLESLEGRRGQPRHKPPYPSDVGLFGRPTLINNVETLYWVRELVQDGPERFLSAGRRGRRGLRSFSVSGRVREPGVKLAPAGISARELIEEYSGGMAPGHRLRAYLPGGASGGLLPASMADLPLDFGTLEEHGSLIGSAALIVLSDRDDIAAAVRNLNHFFQHESCGKCTPCRLGTEKVAALLQRPEWDRAAIEDLAAVMADASICGLGQAAAIPLRTAFRYFPDELP